MCGGLFILTPDNPTLTLIKACFYDIPLNDMKLTLDNINSVSDHVVTKTYNLTSPRGRAAIPASGSIRYVALHAGLHLGYRRRSDKPGSWIAKTNTNGKVSIKTIGIADDGKVYADGDKVLSHQQAVAKAQAASGRPDTATPRGATVQDAMDAWCANKLETLTNYKSIGAAKSDARIIGAAFNCTIASLSVADIAAWHKSYSPKTGDKKLALLKAALTRYTNNPDGPWTKVKRHPASRIKVQPKPAFVLTGEQEQALLVAAPEDFRRFLIFTMRTGCRSGEAYALKIENIVGPDAWLTGKTGTRRIRLQPDLLVQVRRWIGNRPPGDFLLVRAKDGRGWGNTRYATAWKLVARKIDLPPGLSPYCTRHTFISRALQNNVPTARVAEYCGTSEKHIRENYAKWLADDDDKWLAAI